MKLRTDSFHFLIFTLSIVLAFVDPIFGKAIQSDGQPLTAPKKPNIILINLDDADAELFENRHATYLFPNIMQIASEGMTLNNLHVTTPLCGPSRACLYRGQYAHNTNIRVNINNVANAEGFSGGFKSYRAQGFFDNDLSIWMKQAGYRTMMVGKFLHSDYEAIVPPGWDDYYFYLGGKYYNTYRFTNRLAAKGRTDIVPAGIYRTAAETDDAVRLMQEHIDRNNGQPFFLNLNPLGPHRQPPGEPTMIDSRYNHWWTLAQQPFSPAYDEVDFSDKRGHFRPLPRLDSLSHFTVLTHFRERLLATRSVDDMVGVVRQKLNELGIADNTYIFVTSDNGFSLGHHRALGKGTPTERSTHVPLLVFGPQIVAGSSSHQLLGHIDLAPTIVELAGGSVPGFVDGRSFASTLRVDPTTVIRPRDTLLIENWETQYEFSKRSFTASTSVRFRDSVYTEWANGDRDYFDLLTDPAQVENTYDTLAPNEKTYLELTLRTLKNPTHVPRARFSNPFQTSQIIPQGPPLSGMAEDPIGVAAVKLAIRDLGTNRFWNGSQWQAGFILVSAALENPAGQISFWNYDHYPKGSQLPVGEMVAYAWAFDAEGSFVPPTAARFKFDNQGPVLTLTSPQPSQRFTTDAFIYGLMSDEIGIYEVRIQIRDINSNLFWNGKNFQLPPVNNIVRPNRLDRWGLLTPLPSGDYEVSVRGVDTSGNISTSPVGALFSVN